MAQNGAGDVIFTISVNFRDTRINAWRNNESIWESGLSSGGIDWIIGLTEHLRFKHDLLIGRHTAEKTILEIGSAIPLENELTLLIRGRDLKSGLPREIEFASIELREVLDFWLSNLTWNIGRIFEGPEKTEQGITFHPPRIPTSLKPSLTNNPIVLTGEFGLLHGLDSRLQEALGLTVVTSGNATVC